LEQGTHIGFFRREEAVAYFAIGSEAQAVTIQAKGFTDRSDEADAVAIGKTVFGGRSAGVGVGHGSQRAELPL
jgi:hypothetical protein